MPDHLKAVVAEKRSRSIYALSSWAEITYLLAPRCRLAGFVTAWLDREWGRPTGLSIPLVLQSEGILPFVARKVHQFERTVEV